MLKGYFGHISLPSNFCFEAWALHPLCLDSHRKYRISSSFGCFGRSVRDQWWGKCGWRKESFIAAERSNTEYGKTKTAFTVFFWQQAALKERSLCKIHLLSIASWTLLISGQETAFFAYQIDKRCICQAQSGEDISQSRLPEPVWFSASRWTFHHVCLSRYANTRHSVFIGQAEWANNNFIVCVAETYFLVSKLRIHASVLPVYDPLVSHQDRTNPLHQPAVGFLNKLPNEQLPYCGEDDESIWRWRCGGRCLEQTFQNGLRQRRATVALVSSSACI